MLHFLERRNGKILLDIHPEIVICCLLEFFRWLMFPAFNPCWVSTGGYSWSRFSTTKKEIAELVKSMIKNVEQVGRTTVYLQGENAGENVSYLSPPVLLCGSKKIILEWFPLILLLNTMIKLKGKLLHCCGRVPRRI